MCNGQTSAEVLTRYHSVTMANEYASAYLGHVSPHPSRTTRGTADEVTDYPWRTRLIDTRQTQLAVIVATPRVALAIEEGKLLGETTFAEALLLTVYSHATIMAPFCSPAFFLKGG